MAVESGKLELVKTVSGQNQGSLSIDQNASVEVKTGAALDVQNGTVTASGKVYTETGATFTASDEQKENVTVVEDVKALTFTFHPNGVRLPTAPRLTRPSPPSPIPTPRRRPVSSNPATPSADGADLAPMAPIRRTPPLPHSGRATAPAMAAAAPAVPATQFPSPLPPTEA